MLMHSRGNSQLNQDLLPSEMIGSPPTDLSHSQSGFGQRSIPPELYAKASVRTNFMNIGQGLGDTTQHHLNSAASIDRKSSRSQVAELVLDRFKPGRVPLSKSKASARDKENSETRFSGSVNKNRRLLD